MNRSTASSAANTLRISMLAFLSGTICTAIIGGSLVSGYVLGLSGWGHSQIETLQAATSATGANMAVATGSVSDEAEGIFFLDFLTGDLQCLVYYPRTGAFGARFYTNVLSQLPGAGKNSQYLLVTGVATSGRAGIGGAKPGNSLVYVTDTGSGNFAAYSVPWDRTAEGSARPQSGPLLFVGGGPVRNYQIRSGSPSTPLAQPNQLQPLDGKQGVQDAKKPADKQKNAKSKERPKGADKLQPEKN